MKDVEYVCFLVRASLLKLCGKDYNKAYEKDMQNIKIVTQNEKEIRIFVGKYGIENVYIKRAPEIEENKNRWNGYVCLVTPSFEKNKDISYTDYEDVTYINNDKTTIGFDTLHIYSIIPKNMSTEEYTIERLVRFMRYFMHQEAPEEEKWNVDLDEEVTKYPALMNVW